MQKCYGGNRNWKNIIAVKISDYTNHNVGSKYVQPSSSSRFTY